ncbi:hypothetical protein FD16_GL001493 [Paucilactobacillus suebicus DSM 5007 = KCTC 3549]|uniref:MazF family toxin-antitoxin system n=2 Tax=Paucilactobacillus suebicus TaxID=152335 RepID=A0A0R1W189_9LACO|nr:hypothetical protein FD16_GL001493 [Paucilactobacillus suebicus DSM 5007 = KCTC 3549]
MALVESEDGKTRPILILETDGNGIKFFKITSKYENKSAFIKAQYFPITDWNAVGLTKPSYIDTGKIYNIDNLVSFNIKQIGILPVDDINKLAQFIREYQMRIKKLNE